VTRVEDNGMRRYLVRLSFGIVVTIEVASFLCKPSPLPELTRIARQKYDPYCTVLWFIPEPPDIPQEKPVNSFDNKSVYISGTAVSSVSTIVSPSPEDTLVS
jgi:hypothetical protein